MNKLSDREARNLLKAAKKIHAHKLVQIKGYKTLVKRARDERIRQILIQISNDEESHAEFWSARIVELGGHPEGSTSAYFRNRKEGLMMSLLGTKGFFEWAVIGEEEGIHDLAIEAEKIVDRDTSETWSRLASDERIHLERMKTEVLGMETWEIRGGGGVRETIFGANDGLISTLAFVAGVAGAVTDPLFVLIAGMTELFAGTIAIIAGSYQSVKSELEVFERESQRKEVRKGKTLKEEREELIKFYQAEGFKRGEAQAIVDRITRERELSTQTPSLKGLGLAPEELGNPVKSGVLCGVAFGLGALVPIIPFAFHALGITDTLIVSTIATMITLFGVGVMKTIFSRKSWVWSGLEMMVIGASAAGITYIIGTVFSILVSVGSIH